MFEPSSFAHEAPLRAPRLAEDIAQGARLARMYHRNITPAEVASVLNKAGVKYVLVGAHAANGYTSRPRATIDVDIIARHPKKACDAIAKAFTELTAKDTPVVVRFARENGEVAIDVMKPLAPPLWGELIKIARTTEIEGVPVPIPPLEGVLAAKLAAMVSLNRADEKKLFDAGDFITMVKANETIDLDLLLRLGDLIYPGGGEEILRHVADVRAGRKLSI